MTKEVVTYGAVQIAEEVGRLARAHRKYRHLTRETVTGLDNLSSRFLSEFERGKERSEVGKVLKALSSLGLDVIIQPRRQVVLVHPPGKTRQKSAQSIPCLVMTSL